MNKKRITNIIIISIFAILFLIMTIIFNNIKIQKDENIVNIMFLIFLILSIIIWCILIYYLITLIPFKNIKINFKLDILKFKKIIYYVSIITLIVLAILSIIFGFLITIMPIPQILFILNIILTTTLNKNIQNEKLINAIKENNNSESKN